MSTGLSKRDSRALPINNVGTGSLGSPTPLPSGRAGAQAVQMSDF